MKVKIYGAVVVGAKIYDNEEIARLIGQNVGRYARDAQLISKAGRGVYAISGGTGWAYAGDCGAEEGSIVVEIVNASAEVSYVGRKGLHETLWLLMILKSQFKDMEVVKTDDV